MENWNNPMGQDKNNYGQWESLTEIPESQQNNENVDTQEEDIAQRYETAEEINEALECLHEQKEWRDNLNRIGQTILQAIEMSKNDSSLQFKKHPFWRGQIGGPSGVNVAAITNDVEYGYFEPGEERIANEDEKKFLVGKDYDKLFGTPSVNVDGYERPEGVKFADETDFTFENKADNKDISNRINHTLYTLFGENTFSKYEQELLEYGMDLDNYLDAAKYPDDETAIAAVDELIRIVSDIDNNGKLEENINHLEQKKEAFENAAQETVEQEEAIKNQQELAKITESINNGGKLNLESLKMIFSDKNDNDPTAISIRNNIGIETSVIKQLLGNE